MYAAADSNSRQVQHLESTWGMSPGILEPILRSVHNNVFRAYPLLFFVSVFISRVMYSLTVQCDATLVRRSQVARGRWCLHYSS